MNESLKEIKLGAPAEVRVKDCPNLQTLDMQLTQRLTDLSLQGEIGGGAIKRLANILAQRKEELTATESDDLGTMAIGYSDPQAMIDGDHVQLLVKYGNTTVPTDFTWELLEVVEQTEGANPSLTPQGLLTVNEGGSAIVKVRLNNSENVEECLESSVVVGLAYLVLEVAEYAELVSLIIEYPALVSLIIEYPALAPLIGEYPTLVNSLVDTEKRNAITFNNAYFDTGIKPYDDIYVEANWWTPQAIGHSWGARVNSSNHGSSFAVCAVGDSNKPIRVDLPSGDIMTSVIVPSSGLEYVFKGSRTNVDVNGVRYTAPDTKFSGTLYSITLGCINHSGSFTPSNGVKMYYMKFYNDSTKELLHWFVPLTDNKVLDIVTQTILENQGTGLAEFITEDK